MLNIDGDLGRHITIGEYILDTGQIPTRDLFSHTMPGEELTPHEWLAQVLFALAHRALGLSGAVLLASLCIAWALYLVFGMALERSGSVLSVLVVIVVGMAASSLHWLTRPHIFTFLLLAIWLRGLEGLRWEKTSRIPAWVWMPFLMLLWANLHGAFLAGFAVWGIYLIGYIWERFIEGVTTARGYGRGLVLVGGLSLALTLINPDGLGLWRTSLGYLGNRYLVGHTAEYLSPDFHQPAFWPFLLMVAMGLFTLGLSGRRKKVTDLLLFTAWAGMALISARNIPLFVVAGIPILAEALKDSLERLASGGQWFRSVGKLDTRLTAVETSGRGFVWPLAGSLLIVFLAAAGMGRAVNRFDPAVFPVAAVDWLAKHPQEGEVFNYFPWGGYLLYRDWPQTRVFIDGQTDFYGEKLTREYEQVLTTQDGWSEVLDRYSVDWALMPVDERLGQALRSAGWRELYRDETAVILTR